MLFFKYVMGTLFACLGFLLIGLFSSLLMGKTQYRQRFRCAWETVPELVGWIEKIDGDPKHITCLICNVQLSTHLKGLKTHASTAKHKDRKAKLNSKLRTTKLTDKRYESSSEQALAEGHTCLFIAEHCSINTVDHLTEMYKTAFPDATGPKKMALKRTRCSKMITDVIGNHFLTDLIKDIGDHPYSLIIDESNDISSTKYLGVVVRYFSLSQERVVSTFLGFVEVEKCDAQSIVNALKSFLADVGLQLSKLCGIGTDNASVMVGSHNGVYAKLKMDVPNLVLIRCICHSLQLASSHACKETFPDHLDSLIEDTYTWFSLSSKRKSQYKNLYESINKKDPIKIKRACDTRWLSVSVAIDAILTQYDELKQHFKNVMRTENCYKARVLYQMYCDERNRLYLQFLSPVLQEVRITNLNFEAAYQDPTKLASDLVLLLNKLAKSVLDIPENQKNILKLNIRERVKPVLNFGRTFENHYNSLKALKPSDENFISGDKLNAVRKTCLNFMLHLIDQIKMRVPDNVDLLQRISMFSADECLRRNVNRIPDELICLLGKPASDAFKINSQYSTLVNVEWNNTQDTVKFWCEVAKYKNSSYVNPFKDIVDLAFRALSLPHSNADVERTFSVMNIVKNKLRNKMMTKLLNAILYIRYGLKRINKTCSTYVLPDILIRRIKTYSTGMDGNGDGNINAASVASSSSSSASTAHAGTSSASSSTATAASTSDDVCIHIEDDVDMGMDFYFDEHLLI